MVLVLVAGCQNGGATSPEGPVTKKVPSPGTTLMNGQLRLVSITEPTGDSKTFVVKVENLSGKALEDLTASILFYLPPTGNVASFDTKKLEKVFSIYRDDPVLEIPFPLSRASEVTGWEFSIGQAMTAEGSTFLEGKLVCDAVENKLTSSPATLRFELRNATGEALEYLEYQIVFYRGKNPVAETDWHSVGQTIPARDSIVLNATENVPDNAKRAVTVLLKIRVEEL
jgi:hypothetical protein